MPTLKAIRREMINRLLGTGLGRVESIASLTTTTVVVSALARGFGSADDWRGKYMLRAEASTSADRVRRINDATLSSGTFSHAATNYSDTTATNEFVEFWSVDPYFVDQAIQITLARINRLDRTEYPTGVFDKYWLNELSWITQPEAIERISQSSNPVLSRDRYFEKWMTVDTSGNLRLDWWTLSGASATYTRSSTNRRTGYSVDVTRAGTNAVLTQTASLLESGVTGDTLRNRTISVFLVAKTSTASQTRAWISDGVTTQRSSYHTGSGLFEELSTSLTISNSATGLTFGGQVDVDGTPTFDECYIAENTGDNTRRDAWDEWEIDRQFWEFDQSFATNVIRAPIIGRNNQLIVYSKRPFPTFDATRVSTGAADADVTDAPVTLVAIGAIARLFEGLAYNAGEDTSRYRAIAADYGKRFEQMALQYYRGTTATRGGIDIPSQLLAPPPRRRP